MFVQTFSPFCYHAVHSGGSKGGEVAILRQLRERWAMFPKQVFHPEERHATLAVFSSSCITECFISVEICRFLLIALMFQVMLCPAGCVSGDLGWGLC